ncbi:MAG: hypothetical protein EBX37_06355 [Alphaproteobacteria bacterium]|nr:hypothetical protein [Alphaproteobacteria bacterium]
MQAPLRFLYACRRLAASCFYAPRRTNKRHSILYMESIMDITITGKRVAILATDGVEERELQQPM